MKNLFPVFAMLLALSACAPTEEQDIDLPAAPAAPTFSVEFLAGDPNKVVVTNLSSGFFDHTFDLPGGLPAQSKRAVDTILYTTAGDYVITLYASGEGGGGVSKSTKVVTIAQDATIQCDPTVSLLTGDCETPGKCWTFSHAAEAVRVGPSPGSEEWYKSPVNGLQDAQYDDQFCFYFEGSRFVYANNGFSVDPWAGYAVVAYTPPDNLTWQLLRGTGDGGADQIVLPPGTFIGTWDSGPVYDIFSMTETELVLRSPLRTQSGGTAQGWFEFTLVKI